MSHKGNEIYREAEQEAKEEEVGTYVVSFQDIKVEATSFEEAIALAQAEMKEHLLTSRTDKIK